MALCGTLLFKHHSRGDGHCLNAFRCLLLTHSGHRVGRWRSAETVAEALSVTQKWSCLNFPGDFMAFGANFWCQFFAWIVDL